MRCLRKLVVGLGDFRLPKWDSSQTLGKKKDVSVFLILVFSKATQFEKLPPAISLRLFQRDHFVETAPQGACQQDCLLARASVARFLSSLILFPPYSYIFANLILYTLSKTKYCVQSESQTR